MKYSHVVIIARVISKEAVINSSRNTFDHSKPSDDLFAVGQVFKVEVEQYLKGNGAKEILIVQVQGLISAEQFEGEHPSDTMIEQAIAQNEGKEYIPPTIQVRYLMFLHAPIEKGYMIDGYPVELLYNTALNPWLFEITENNLVTLVSEVAELNKFFPAQLLDDVILQLDQTLESTPAYP